MPAYLVGFVYGYNDALCVVLIRIAAGLERGETDLVQAADIAFVHGRAAQVDDGKPF